jgi:terminase small subunit / prophage DNA-packing protein
LNPDKPVKQSEFADWIGVTQQAVSDLVGRGVLQRGQSLREWTLAYCNHMRGVASGRGSDGDLARERAELTRVTRERAQIKLALELGESAPVSAIEQVLSAVGRTVAGQLEPLPGVLHKLCPALTPEALVEMQRAISAACESAAAASLALLGSDEDEDEEDDFAEEDEGDGGVT